MRITAGTGDGMREVSREESPGARSRCRTLVFDLFLDETPLYARVAERLARDYGPRSVGVTLGRRYRRSLDGASFPLHSISGFCREVWPRITPSVVAEYEARYGAPSLSRYLIADRHLANYIWYGPGYSGDHGARFLVANLMFWEDLVRKEGLGAGDVVVVPGAAFLPHFAAYFVAGRHGLAFWNLFISREGLDRFVVSDTLSDNSTYLQRRFRSLLDRDLTDAERAEAEGFLESFRRSRPKPQYMQNPTQHRTLQWRQIGWLLQRLYNYHVDGWGGDPFDFLTLHPVRYAIRDLSGIVLARWLRSAGAFEAPREGERFVLFPLQLQPEATTMVWAPPWDNQIAVVENLAKAMPLDCVLYVKEHYSALGRRSPGYYRRIRRLPNVRLITPFADSHELIQRAEAVVTITSTVGWEAILYERPVITLGDVFYNASGLNVVVGTFDELGWAIRDARRRFTLDRERLLRFVLAVRRGYLEGNISLPHVRPEVLDPSNVDRVAGSLHDALLAL